MAQTNYTPIQLYYSSTASAVPVNTNLASGELAINITDGKLFYKDNAGAVQTLATKAATSGTFATTTISTSETLSYGTANGVAYLNGSKVVTTGSALTFDGSRLAIGTATSNIQLTTTVNTNQAYISLADADGRTAVFRGPNSGSPNAAQIGTTTNHETSFLYGGAEVMRLTGTSLYTASGINVGIGTSSPAYKLDLSATASGVIARFKTTGNYGIVVADNGNTTGGGGFSARQNGTQYSIFGLDGAVQGTTSTDTAIFADGTGSAIRFYTNGSPSVKAILDSSGNLGIGTGSPPQKLSVNGGLNVLNSATLPAAQGSMLFSYESAVNRCYMGDGTGYSFAFSKRVSSTTTDLMTLTDSGNLLVGATSAANNERLNVTKSVTFYLSRFINTQASGNVYGLFVSYPNFSPNNADNQFFACNDSTANRVTFYSNGGLANYSANNVNLSDRREKTNFAPAGSYLDKICTIPVQTFNYIDQNMEDDGGLTLGVVAQDVQAVAPELVMESNWGTEDDPKMRLSIYQTDLQYALMKCIQEQQAIIQSLTARITALEGA